MLTSFADLFRHIGQVWSQVGINQKIAIGIAGAALVATLLFWSDYAGKPDYVPLYPGKLSMEDAAQVREALQAKGVSVKLGGDGTTVLVPEDEVYRRRLELASENGLPQGGAGFANIFDKNQSLIAPDNNTQRIRFKRAVQGELEKTIASLDKVDWARVMVVMPEKDWLFDESKKPTASVTIRTRGRAPLGQSQVSGIAHLVGASVEGLQPRSVTVTDHSGMRLWPPDDAESGNGSGIERDKKAELEANIHRELDPIVGPGKVAVCVTATMDHTQTDEVRKILSTKQNIKSEDTTETLVTDSPAGGEANVNPTARAGGGKPAVIEKSTTSRTEYYEPEHVGDTKISKPGGEVKRITASVVVEAGTWSTDTDGKRTYQPGKAEVLTDFEKCVQLAIGYDEKRGDEVVVQDKAFWQPEELIDPGIDIVGQVQRDMVPMLIKHGPVVLMLGAFVFFARKAMKKMTHVELPLAAGTTVAQAAAMLPGAPALHTTGGFAGGEGQARQHSAPEDSFGFETAEPPGKAARRAPAAHDTDTTVETLRSWMNE